VQDHLRPARLDRIDLDLGGGGGHDDGRGATELLRGERHALSMVARRRGDDTACERSGREIDHLVVCAAALEGEHRLHVLALQEHPVAEPRGKIGRDFERRLERNVVDSRLQDPLEIVVFHANFRTP